jgi:hypothetical protein
MTTYVAALVSQTKKLKSKILSPQGAVGPAVGQHIQHNKNRSVRSKIANNQQLYNRQHHYLPICCCCHHQSVSMTTYVAALVLQSKKLKSKILSDLIAIKTEIEKERVSILSKIEEELKIPLAKARENTRTAQKMLYNELTRISMMKTKKRNLRVQKRDEEEDRAKGKDCQ